MRTLTFLLSIGLLSGCGGKSDDPAPAVLGTDQLVFDSTRLSANREIFAMKTDGTGARRLTSNAAYQNWWPRVSHDRKKILFYRRPAAVQSDDYTQASLWVMNADGTGVTQLIAQGANGWSQQGHAEWSPDGTKIAMFGSSGAALEIFVTDANGRNPVQYTNRGGVNTDVSWSPDGDTLLFNGCPSASSCVPANYEIYAMPATPLASATRITNDGLADYDPYFSPDGTHVAWLVNVDPSANPMPAPTPPLGRWAIRIAVVGQNPTYLIDDGQINSKPAWSLDNQTVFFHRMVPPEYRFRVFRINVNGTGLTELSPGVSGLSEHPSN